MTEDQCGTDSCQSYIDPTTGTKYENCPDTGCMTTSYVNGTVDTECTWTPYSFCVSYPDMCVSGYPDLAAICDNIYAFPPEYFTGTNFLEVCEVNLDDACTEFPDLCTEDGSFSTDVCGMYPEKCDTASQDYNPCASDLYACMTDVNFDLCTEFPELCGMTTNYRPPLAFANPDSPSQYVSFGDQEMFGCSVTIQESFATVQSVIDSLNHYENMGIEAG